MNKPLAIGIENFKEIISKNYYYVDKTLLMKDLLSKGGKVNLFTRPRRFGKTLALSMIRTFFEKEMDVSGRVTDNSPYFVGMKIMQTGERYIEELGQYPVISLSLKSGKQPDFEMAYQSILDEIIKEYERHRYVLLGECLTDAAKEKYVAVMSGKAEPIAYAKALDFLSYCLKQYHGKNVIILLDEYDVPLENAYFQGFYERMIMFIRSLFESALKTNDNLEFAVITGCLRISKESIFTGLNNLKIISVLSDDYAEYFGFTQDEVEEMLDAYGIEKRLEEVKQWYNGYLFGNVQVYNPWSVINYVDGVVHQDWEFPKPYWSNTSSNRIIRELVEHADYAVRQEIEDLIAGKTIEKPIQEDITYEDIYKTQDNLWNFLFFTGYLKKTAERFAEDTIYLTLAIPNAEVRYIYRNTILEWFDEKIGKTDLSALYRAVIEGDCDTFSNMVSEQLVETISFYDYAESYYHGFLSGLLKGCSGYITLSNRESGNGRPDIIMKTPSVRGMAIIMEIKIAKDFEKMEEGCNAALKQIAEQHYEASLYKEGYRRFLKYGICFYRKECMVMKVKE